MTGQGGWREGTRHKRRLGTLDVSETGNTRWVGFAGLGRTTVEKLIKDGETRDEDKAAAQHPASNQLASLRHVLGGECPSVNTRTLIACIRATEHAVVRNGGDTSDLRGVLVEARAHLVGAPTRNGNPDLHTQRGWEALRCVIGCNVPTLDWAPPGGMTEKECKAWRQEIDKELTGHWLAIIEEARGLQSEWLQTAAPVINQRARMEAGRGTLRVLIRAWREVVDDVRAGAAKWETRWTAMVEQPVPVTTLYRCECRYWTKSRVAFWRHERTCQVPRSSGNGKQVNMTHLALAKRLTFASDGTSIWSSERGWRMRMLLAWQRLVRAPKVTRSRKGSDMWREGEQHRVANLSEQYKTELHTDEDWADNTDRVRGQRYHWDTEADMQTQHQVSSGAAAVLARRRTQRREQQALRTTQSGDSTE